MMGQVVIVCCVLGLIKLSENIFEAFPSGFIYFTIRFDVVEFTF